MFGPRTASGLERDLGISRHRVDQALSDLDDAGAAQPITAAAGHAERRWRASSSEETARVLRKWRYRRRMQDLPMNEPYRSLRGLELGEGLRHLPSREATRERLAELVAVAARSHMSMNPETSFEPDAMRAAAPLDRRLQSRGVRIQVLGITQGDPDLLLPYGGLPKEVLRTYRRADTVPMKLIVVDRRVAFFPVEPGDLDRGYLEVSQAPVVDSLVASFEKHWAAAHDLSETMMPAFELSPREQAVVALLSMGHTDAGVARELRISERSVSNILRSMMDRFGVDNRFQLGVALGTLQIAPVPPRMPLTRHGDGDAGQDRKENGESK